MIIDKLTPEQLDRYIHLQSIVARQETTQAKVRAYRSYYDGDHPVYLSNRQMEYLGDLGRDVEFSFAHNLVKTVVDTLRERLDVQGFTVNGASADVGEEDEVTEDGALAALMWSWWTENKMPMQQSRAHRRAIRDGETFVMVDYDAATDRPRLSLQSKDDGTVGIVLHRDPERVEDVVFVCKYFYTSDLLNPGATGKERKNVYLPGEIRKYVRDGMVSGGWAKFQDPDDGAWPLPWVDRAGQPLGIPIFEFQNPGGSEIDQIIGLQNAVNKSELDLLAGADAQGFPILVASYAADTMASQAADDEDLEGADEFRVAPGRMVELFGGTMQRIPGADLAPMIATVKFFIQAISGVSRTPSYYLEPVGGDVPSGEALKQLESGLVQRALERQMVFGATWAEIMAMALKVQATFGTGVTPSTDVPDIEVQWRDANTRNDATMAQVATAHKALGVPDEAVWAQAGYSPAQIAAFKQTARDQRMAEVAAIASAIQIQASRNAPQTNPQTFQQANPRTGVDRNG